MESNENNWHVGDIAILPWTSNTFKISGSDVYKHFFRSRYICIRESDDLQRGILVKVLAKTAPHRILIRGGEPFCKDDVDDLFKGHAYSSFRFPTLDELKEALEIIRSTPSLQPVFKEASMNVELDGSFWVRETGRTLMMMKKPQFYDARTGRLSAASDDEPRNRLSIVYFHDGKLIG